MYSSFRMMGMIVATGLMLMGVQGKAEKPVSGGQPDPVWTAVAASGQVEANTKSSSAANWRQLIRGNTVPAMSRVRTQEKSRATLTRGGDIVLVSERSEVLLPGLPDGDSMVIQQSSGKALYQFEPRKQGRVEIVTPYLVAGVKGTVFSVIMETDFTSVTVVTGHVEVRSLLTGALVDLFAGDMALLESRDGSLSVQRSRAETADLAPVELSQNAKQSRKATGQLVRTASHDDLSWEAKKTELWKDLADETWNGGLTELAPRSDRMPLTDDKVVSKSEQDARNLICRTTGVKCN